MNKTLSSSIIFLLSFILLVLLYWPSLKGTPIWDDYYYWFEDPVLSDIPYLKIFRNYAWPFSISFQKFLLNWWGKESFLPYHLVSIVLHFSNGIMLFALGKRLKLKWPLLFFLLFLFHPTNAISVAWMIQIKTLLCLFFALSSILVFLKGLEKSPWMLASWGLFFLSLASKSASLILPLVLICLSYPKLKFEKKWLFLIPFFILSSLSTYRTLNSQSTQEGISRIQETSQLPAPQMMEEPVSLFQFDVELIAQTMNYYFWQVLLPFNNAPIKGLNRTPAGTLEILHLIFLILLLLILWRRITVRYLVLAHLIILPFLGIIPAPFMNITWVSDQHLYLALPVFVAFWLKLLEELPFDKVKLLPIPALFLIFFTYKTSQVTHAYSNQVAFYEESLRYNPLNVPIVYNLAFTYLREKKLTKARELLLNIKVLADEDPTLKQNLYWQPLQELYRSVIPIRSRQ